MLFALYPNFPRSKRWSLSVISGLPDDLEGRGDVPLTAIYREERPDK